MSPELSTDNPVNITHIVVKPEEGGRPLMIKDDEIDMLKTNYHLTSNELELLIKQGVLYTQDFSFHLNE